MKYYVEYLGRTIADEYGNKVDTKAVSNYFDELHAAKAEYHKATKEIDAARDMINVYDQITATIAMVLNRIVSDNTNGKASIFADLYNNTIHYIEDNTDVVLTEANAEEYGVKPTFIHAFNYMANKQAAAYNEFQDKYAAKAETLQNAYYAKTAAITNKYMEEIPMPNLNNRVDEDGMVWNNAADAEYALLHYILGDYKSNLSVYFD